MMKGAGSGQAAAGPNNARPLLAEAAGREGAKFRTLQASDLADVGRSRMPSVRPASPLTLYRREQFKSPFDV